MHIGILQCDHVVDELMPTFGDYPDMFRRLLLRTDPTRQFTVYDLTRNQFPASANDHDAWLITGSKWSTCDADPWIRRAEDFIRELHAHKSRTVGICFGHQLIAQSLGGKVEQAGHVGWGVGVHETAIKVQRPWMDPPASTLSLLVSHQDQVTALPEGAQVLASHDFCPIDMYELEGHMLGFQGHPEFPKEYSRSTMVRRRHLIGEETFESGVSSLENPINESIAAQWILRFMSA